MILTKILKMAPAVRDKCLSFLMIILRGIKASLFQLIFSFSYLNSDLSLAKSVSNAPSRQAVLPQYGYTFQKTGQSLYKTPQLPAIYSGIGLGVYQGETVVFRQMATGEKRWVMSKLQFEDLNQLPHSILSDLCLTLCFLRLSHKQSDLLKQGLQTKGVIELMKYHCPQADNLDMLLKEISDDDNHAKDGEEKQAQD